MPLPWRVGDEMDGRAWRVGDEMDGRGPGAGVEVVGKRGVEVEGKREAATRAASTRGLRPPIEVRVGT